MTYSLFAYANMIADQVRVEAYSRALRHAVKPGSTVLDLGTGTGFFAILACRFGARKVYAIEVAEAVALARQAAIDNGYDDRIEFHERVSMEVDLPERVDVIVSDLRGILPWHEHHIQSIIDARNRFLAPRGTLIPRRDMLLAAVVEAPEKYAQRIAPWQTSNQDLGVDMTATRERLVNTWFSERFEPAQLLTEPCLWGTLEYHRVDSDQVRGQVSTKILREGVGHGVVIWFDTELADGIGFSNAPGAPQAIYASAFFPWTTPVSLQTGDVVTVNLKADLVGDDYLWRWETTVHPAREPGAVQARFRQSTFHAIPLSTDRLRKREVGHIPRLTEDGEIDCFTLSLMDGRRTLHEIAELVANRFPRRFSGWREALDQVGELSLRHSQ